MVQLRITTTQPYSLFAEEIVQEPIIGTDRLKKMQSGEVIVPEDLKGQTAYLHDKLQDMAGFDIPLFVDGNMGQLDLPVEEQDIVFLIPTEYVDKNGVIKHRVGKLKCKAELQEPKRIDRGAYYITLKDN